MHQARTHCCIAPHTHLPLRLVRLMQRKIRCGSPGPLEAEHNPIPLLHLVGVPQPAPHRLVLTPGRRDAKSPTAAE